MISVMLSSSNAPRNVRDHPVVEQTIRTQRHIPSAVSPVKGDTITFILTCATHYITNMRPVIPPVTGEA